MKQNLKTPFNKRKPCSLHSPDVQMCWCGYIRADILRAIGSR